MAYYCSKYVIMQKSIFTTLLLCVFTFSLSAQYSLKDCIEVAVENNLTLVNPEIQIKNAEINRKLAEQSRYPNLSGNTGVSFNFGRTIDPTTNEFINQTFISNNYGLSTGVLLYNGGALRNGLKQSELDLTSAKLDRDQAVRDISLNVATGYLNVLFAKENLSIAINNRATTQQQLDQLQIFIDAGSRAANERLDIDAQLAQNDQAIVTAENNLVGAKINLAQLMQVQDADFEIVVPTEVSVFSDPDLITLDELYTAALANQRSYEATDYKIKSSELGIKIAKAALIPTVTIGGQFGTNYSNQSREVVGQNAVINEFPGFINNTPALIGIPGIDPVIESKAYGSQFIDNLSYGFGVNVGIPIYSRYQNKAGIERAKLQLETSRVNRDLLAQQVMTTAQNALANARSAKASYRAAQAVRSSQEAAYQNSQRQYELGALGSFEIANIKLRLDNAITNELIAKYQYLFNTKVLDFYLGKPINIQ